MDSENNADTRLLFSRGVYRVGSMGWSVLVVPVLGTRSRYRAPIPRFVEYKDGTQINPEQPSVWSHATGVERVVTCLSYRYIYELDPPYKKERKTAQARAPHKQSVVYTLAAILAGVVGTTAGNAVIIDPVSVSPCPSSFIAILPKLFSISSSMAIDNT